MTILNWTSFIHTESKILSKVIEVVLSERSTLYCLRCCGRSSPSCDVQASKATTSLLHQVIAGRDEMLQFSFRGSLLLETILFLSDWPEYWIWPMRVIAAPKCPQRVRSTSECHPRNCAKNTIFNPRHLLKQYSCYND